jgi:hypothetical protein
MQVHETLDRPRSKAAFLFDQIGRPTIGVTADRASPHDDPAATGIVRMGRDEFVVTIEPKSADAVPAEAPDRSLTPAHAHYAWWPAAMIVGWAVILGVVWAMAIGRAMP